MDDIVNCYRLEVKFIRSGLNFNNTTFFQLHPGYILRHHFFLFIFVCNKRNIMVTKTIRFLGGIHAA
jgi:hypothetical protein